jgi:hypothetical protein
MNFKTFYLAGSLFCSLVGFCLGQPAETKGQPLSRTQTQLLETMNRCHMGSEALKGYEALGLFLKTWNPIGRSTHEVKAMLGACKEAPDTLFYYFDTGLYGGVFEFKLQKDKVTEVKNHLY